MFKKSLLAAALAMPLAAFAFPTTFNNSTLGGGTDNVTFSQISLSGGGSTITLSDTDGSGNISLGDQFTESGLVAGVAFLDMNKNPVAGTDLGQTYELWAVFDPLVGYVSGAAFGAGLGDYLATFTTPSSVTLYYDTTLGGGFNSATATAIGMATSPAANSQCEVWQSQNLSGAVQNSGSCVLNFQFDEAGITAPGVWTAFGGTDVGNLDNASLRVDLNIDGFDPGFFTYAYDSSGQQIVTINHDGSAEFVPEPGSLALVGLGMLGLFGVTRRRNS